MDIDEERLSLGRVLLHRGSHLLVDQEEVHMEECLMCFQISIVLAPCLKNHAVSTLSSRVGHGVRNPAFLFIVKNGVAGIKAGKIDTTEIPYLLLSIKRGFRVT